MDKAAPVRITFGTGSSAAVNRSFIGGFFAFAILFAGAAFYRPAIQAFAVGFPIYVVVWMLRLRKATKQGWALEVTDERLVLETPDGQRSVLRDGTTRVRIGKSIDGRATFEVVDLSGRSAIHQEFAASGLNELTGALRAKGWNLEG